MQIPKLITMSLGLLAVSLAGTAVLSDEMVFPDFEGSQSEFSWDQTRIVEAMRRGPNFANHYTLITAGCGTNCRTAYIGDNATGELYHFPFGGEENHQMQIEFSSASDIIDVSFQDNPFIETPDGLTPAYSPDEMPCVAHKLQFSEGQFIALQSREIERFGRYCPPASQLFDLNSRGLSSFEEACFSTIIRHNTCDDAARIVKETHGRFPQTIDAELTILSLVAEGPKLRFIAQWGISRTEIARRLNAIQMTNRQLFENLELAARESVCADIQVSAFIRLGGELGYTYLDANHSIIHNFSIHNCDL